MTTTATLNVSGNQLTLDCIVNNLTPYTVFVITIRGVTGSVDEWLYGNFSSIGPIKTDEACKFFEELNILNKKYLL